ncbi:MAG: universal stress protein [Candidatus Competibacteraceae bacterium]|nr:universal stress protein [Candidatus Competibacteraceae bacterium]MCB1816139.1 universal stress protein [Candidatus Competibacteraceae bacterium]
MALCYVVAVDGSDGGIKAAKYALEKATQASAELKIIHVLQWSPYSFLTPEELAERHKRRGEELQRAQTAICQPIVRALGNTSVPISTEVRYGNISEVITKYCTEVKAAEVFVGRHGGSHLATRMFGSVPGTLIQISDIPVTVVP